MSDDAQIPASKSYWPRRWPWLVTEALIVFVAAVTAYAPLRHDASGLALTLTVAATVAYACLTIEIMILNRRQVAALQEQVAIARGDAKRSQEALTQARTQATAELAVAQEASYRLTSARIAGHAPRSCHSVSRRRHVFQLTPKPTGMLFHAEPSTS